jgi:hypothetical protein
MNHHYLPLRLRFLLLLAIAVISGPTEAQTQQISLRPHPEGEPAPIQVGVFVFDVTKVDDESQSFNVDFHLSVRWHDPRLAAPEGDLGVRRFNLDQVWHPALDLLNQRDINLRLPKVVLVDAEGNVHYRQRFFGTLSSPLDLREFPFDQHILPIHLISYTYGTHEVALTVDEARTGNLGEFSAAGWGFERGEVRVFAEQIRSLGEERARMTFEIIGRRDSGFYLFTAILPLSLIVLMAWAVFWIDPEYLPSQIGLSTASVFTLIAFRLSLRLMLPPVSYMTKADQFLFGATLLVFLALGEAVATGGMAKRGQEELAKKVDRWSRWIYAAAFAVICVVTLVL